MTSCQNSPSSLLDELQARGLIAQTTERVALIEALKKPISFYCGFDPTADSLHVGHLLLIVLSQHLQRAGHRPFFVMGGATGRIGDPSFKGKERELTPIDFLKRCVSKLGHQFKTLFDFSTAPNAAQLVNNLTWTTDLNVLVFLREIGKHFSLNSMLQKEAIRQRIERPETGISYTEFSYVLLQAYDYWHLYKNHHVTLQLGGSDQWGNIIAGVNLVAQKEHVQVHALTIPLITKADGSKFGKTESGVVWLSPKKTSPYAFYQFWMQTPDAVVLDYLKKFTFLTLEELQPYQQLDQFPANTAQRLLAKWMTRWIHGESITAEIERINHALFSSKAATLSKESLDMISTLPKMKVATTISLIKALRELQLSPSLQEAKRHLEQGSVYINDVRVEPFYEQLESTRDKLPNGYTILRRGKKNYALIEWI